MHFTLAGEGKFKRGRRVVLNAKHKHRDRWKPKREWKFGKYPRHQDAEWYFGRAKAPPETGYGIAFERRVIKD